MTAPHALGGSYGFLSCLGLCEDLLQEQISPIKTWTLIKRSAMFCFLPLYPSPSVELGMKLVTGAPEELENLAAGPRELPPVELRPLCLVHVGM